MAIDKAIADVRNKKNINVPNSLKDGHYSGAKKLGHSVGYIYPHDYPGDWIAQQYLPTSLLDANYFTPKGNSKIEETLKTQYYRLKKMQKDGLNQANSKY